MLTAHISSTRFSARALTPALKFNTCLIKDGMILPVSRTIYHVDNLWRRKNVCHAGTPQLPKTLINISNFPETKAVNT